MLSGAGGLAALLLASAGGWPSRGEAGSAGAGRPNVVVVISDDQTQASMWAMDEVRRRIGGEGLTFRHSFVNLPLCCPSRATFLTGQYAHNHGVLANRRPNGGFDKLNHARTLPVWLRRAGYHTSHVGKYMNGYERHRDEVPPLVPPGWSEWYGTTKTYRYYGYQLNRNGVLVDYGEEPADYQTDVLTELAVDVIERRAPLEQPFFLSLAYLAPHTGGPEPNPNPPRDCDGEAKPAPRHAHSFDRAPLPTPPSFNEANLSDKPAAIRELEPLGPFEVRETGRVYRCRLESLLAVDEGVAQLVRALRRASELRNTYVVYTSDNGFFQGEHRIRRGKRLHYEEASRVPLLIRGPGIPHGEEVRGGLVTNADLAPTILEIAGASADRFRDGLSLLPLAGDPSRERGRELLIEGLGYAAIRTRRYLYAEHSTGERELYDLRRDPYELESRHLDPGYDDARGALAERLRRLRDCRARQCRRRPGLKLRLDFRAGRKGREGTGKRCARRPIRAWVRGDDKRSVERVGFYVRAKRVASDRRRPLRRRLRYRRFRHRGKTEVRARATLVDGRRRTIDRRLRACRRGRR